MTISHRTETLVLFLGDVCILYATLLLTLFFRYRTSTEFDLGLMIRLHLLPFSLLFVLWVFVFFVAGLYEKHTLFLQKQLPQLLFKTLAVNSVVAALFFYFLPAFKITPKINLFIYLFVSSVFLFFWRRSYLYRMRSAEREPAALIGAGEEMRSVLQEVNHNSRYQLSFVVTLDMDAVSTPDVSDLLRRIKDECASLIIADLYDSRVQKFLPRLYALLFSGIRFADLHEVYEELFDRVPLSLLKYHWFLKHVSPTSRPGYHILKRAMDVTAAALLGALSLFIYPLAYAAVKLDDGGPLFVLQERVGRNNRVIRTVKFRTMTRDDKGLAELKKGNTVTRVGAFLRAARLDELPQLWNVLRGEMSLIGPRPELPSLVQVYEQEVPFYDIRHLIKPGLSGWAQLYHRTPPKVHANPDETAVKLSYDLYYLKNRSFWLDLKIAVKTIKVLLSRSGV